MSDQRGLHRQSRYSPEVIAALNDLSAVVQRCLARALIHKGTKNKAALAGRTRAGGRHGRVPHDGLTIAGNTPESS